jgi:ATP-dependent Clp protease ATP-binding subunit ClpC
VFERFTERARQVVVLAQEEARGLGHGYIGTEHILLGLLREMEGLAARVLESLDVKLEDVRAEVAGIVGPGDEATTGQIPFTPRAKKVLELSLREALALGHDYIGTEHVLLGIVREGRGVAVRILDELGAPGERVREEVLRTLGGVPGVEAGARPVGLRRRRRRRLAYRVLVVESAAGVTEELLAPLGAEGWRLAAALPDGDGVRLVLERPV